MSITEVAMLLILIAVVAIVGCALIPPQVTNAVFSLLSPVPAYADNGSGALGAPFAASIVYSCDDQAGVHEQKIAEMSAMFRFGNQFTVPAGCQRNIILNGNYHSTEDRNSDGSVLVGIWPGK